MIDPPPLLRIAGIACLQPRNTPSAPIVCFEHGFPELALDLALAGADLLAISSAIRRGTEHFRELRSRARAQDNACYVVAANAVGGPYCGASMIIDPLGAVLGYAGVLRRRGVDVAVVDGIEREARRIDGIVRGLLDYARPGGSRPGRASPLP